MYNQIFFSSFQTALHWAAKHGNENVVKLIAGTCKADVNCRTVSWEEEMSKDGSQLNGFPLISIDHRLEDSSPECGEWRNNEKLCN